MGLQPKKMTILYILEILRKYSDEDHPLTQQDIMGFLKKDYEMEVNRKTIRRNLLDLIDAGFEIECKEVPRANARAASPTASGMLPEDEKEDNENIQLTDIYIRHNFEESELRLLVDSLLFSRHIPEKQKKELVDKLAGLSSIYFRHNVTNITTPPSGAINKQLFFSIETIDDAIRENKQIFFKYQEYHTDKQLHNRTREDGSEREYIVNPYQIAAMNGRYYLIGNLAKYKTITHFRIDRIANIEKLDTQRRPATEVEGFEKGFSLSKHMAEHLYMYSDKAERVTFRVNKTLLTELFDWFDSNMRFSKETNDTVVVSITASPAAMRLWATEFAKDVTILSPAYLQEQVKGDLKEAYERYLAEAIQ